MTITAFVLLILEIPLGVTSARSDERRLVSDLERDAFVLGTFAEDTLEGLAEDDLQTLAEQYQERTGGRVVITDADGVSVADSERPDGPRRDFSTRPEFVSALGGSESSGTRSSETLGERIVFVAVPVASGGEVHGAVRVTLPRSELDASVRRNWIALILLAVVILAAVSAVGALLARSVTRPLRAVSEAARRLADGDLSARAPVDAGPPEVRELASQFNDMAARLERLLDAQRAFVADASHELRTPLTAMRLRLENLEAELDDPRAAEVTAATDEIRRLGRLVDAMLALARAEGSRGVREVVDLSEVALSRVVGWRDLAEEQNVRLVAEIDDRVRALAVSGSTEQILDNLLANALEAAPSSTTVTVRVHRHGNYCVIRVVDEGPGLPADQRMRAFDRFWRAPGAAPGSSGLGLAVVRQVVEVSGGRARLDEGPHGGVDAVVELPAAGA